MIEIPCRIVSIQNESSHWRVAATRRQKERTLVGWHIRLLAKPELPCTVTLTRIAPRPLDGHDNLRSGFKAPVDAIAEWLGVKDNDPRVTWQYAQEQGKPKTYSIRMELSCSK